MNNGTRLSIVSALFALPAVVTLGLVACGGDPPPEPKMPPAPQPPVTATAPEPTPAPVATTAEPTPAIRTQTAVEEAKILSFARGADSGKVDKVGMADGAMKPDGQKDVSFTVKFTGPVDAFFLTAVDKSGDPIGDFQADTLVGSETMPNELAKHMKGGKTLGIGVFEGDKLANAADGSLRGKFGAGEHAVTLYVANVAAIKPGKAVRLYAMMPDGTVVASMALPK